MSAPIITLTDGTDTNLPVLTFGVVDAGSQTSGILIRIWNNFANANGVSQAQNPQITTKTFNGLDGGDSIANGNEVVQNQMIAVRCNSQGDTAYTNIGGANTAPIADAPNQNPHIIASSSFAECLVRANVPPASTPGNINFLIRVTYQYS